MEHFFLNILCQETQNDVERLEKQFKQNFG